VIIHTYYLALTVLLREKKKMNWNSYHRLTVDLKEAGHSPLCPSLESNDLLVLTLRIIACDSSLCFHIIWFETFNAFHKSSQDALFPSTKISSLSGFPSMIAFVVGWLLVSCSVDYLVFICYVAVRFSKL